MPGPTYKAKSKGGPGHVYNKKGNLTKPAQRAQAKRTFVSQPSRSTVTSITGSRSYSPSRPTSGRPSRSTKPRRPKTPKQRLRTQIKRRVLSGKETTPKQTKFVSKRPKLKQRLAERRAKQVLKREAPKLNPPKLTPKLKTKLSSGKGEKQLIKAARLPKRKLKKPKPYPGLDREQAKVLNTVLSTGLKKGATKKELTAATETAIVESGIRNLKYGDRDSLGWRQERTSIYGTGKKGPTNVRASARRYFSETAAAGRGKGQTAGELAQSVQRSAFPERYDQVKAQAKPLVKTFVKNVKRSGGKLPKVGKAPGPWAGSKKVAKELTEGIKAPPTSTKRTPGENSSVGGSSTSDHLTTSTDAWAFDFPDDPAISSKIAKRLGIKGFKHGGNYTVNYKGYRVQLLTAPHGTGPHVHLGIKWAGGAIPEGTTLGGSVNTSGGATTTTAGGSVSPPAGRSTPTKGKTTKKKRKKPRFTPAQKELLKEIETRQRERTTPKTPTPTRRKTSRKVELGL